MKKVFLIVCLSVLCVALSAKVKITSGSAAFLKEEATAVLVMDYSEATWEDDQSYQSWCGEDYEQRVELSYSSVALGFNKNSDNLKIRQQDSATARYRITIKVETMEQKMGGGWGRFYTMCTGTLTVVDISTGAVVCTAQIKREDGDTDYVPNDRLAKCFFHVGKAMARMR